MGSMVEKAHGIHVLYPYLMPETVDEWGETQRHGRYAIAYSRDGWYVLDNEKNRILRWSPDEQGAIDYRLTLLTSE